MYDIDTAADASPDRVRVPRMQLSVAPKPATSSETARRTKDRPDDQPRDRQGLLQSLEHSLDATDRVSGLCRHRLNAQRDGTAIVPSALQRYEAQLVELTTQRERMRESVAKWWTILEKGH